MKYVISEEELSSALEDLISNACQNMHKVAHDFLKSKKHVTEIASGEVEDDIFEYEAYFHIGEKDLLNIFKGYDGKKIKIYIEEGE